MKTRRKFDGMGRALTARMPPVVIYKDLDAWKQAMELVEHCYRLSTVFPRDERFGVTSQMRRAAVSIPANIAEGYCRRKTRVYAHQ